jgi:hypothetical protein
MPPKKQKAKPSAAAAAADDDIDALLDAEIAANAALKVEETKAVAATVAAAAADDDDDDDDDETPAAGAKKNDKKKKKKGKGGKAETDARPSGAPVSAHAKAILERQALLQAEDERVAKLQFESDEKVRLLGRGAGRVCAVYRSSSHSCRFIIGGRSLRGGFIVEETINLLASGSAYLSRFQCDYEWIAQRRCSESTASAQ